MLLRQSNIYKKIFDLILFKYHKLRHYYWSTNADLSLQTVRFNRTFLTQTKHQQWESVLLGLTKLYSAGSINCCCRSRVGGWAWLRLGVQVTRGRGLTGGQLPMSQNKFYLDITWQVFESPGLNAGLINEVDKRFTLFNSEN